VDLSPQTILNITNPIHGKVLELDKQEHNHINLLMAMQHFQEPVQHLDKLLLSGQRPLVTNSKELLRVVYQPIHKVPHWRQIQGSLFLVKDHHHRALISLDRSSIQDSCQAPLIATWLPQLVLPRTCGGRCTNQPTKHQHTTALRMGHQHLLSSPLHL
jgi:hypothetical protein